MVQTFATSGSAEALPRGTNATARIGPKLTGEVPCSRSPYQGHVAEFID
jgi:hypothetical protein